MEVVMGIGVVMIVGGLLALAAQAISHRRGRKRSRRWAIVQAMRG
jgi:Na+-transporting methylmalonyl-CoA/oxaloacetate decarboxylase gamma subunit